MFSLLNRTPPHNTDTEPQPATPAGPEQAADLRAAAAKLRTDAEQARTEAAALVQRARAEAQRLVTDAEQQAATLTGGLRTAESRAGRLDERASHLEYADVLRDQIEDARQQAARLTAEGEALKEQRTTLAERLTALGTHREEVAEQLDTARNAGDVGAVSGARTELSAIDDVTAVLTGQRDAALTRLQAIGGSGEGRGELPDAEARAAAADAELRRVLNTLDPSRPEAHLDVIRDGLMAAVERATAPDEQRPRQVVLRAGG
jgi:chromosome segregation ATPase